jgi:hypothetical protein
MGADDIHGCDHAANGQSRERYTRGPDTLRLIYIEAKDKKAGDNYGVDNGGSPIALQVPEDRKREYAEYTGCTQNQGEIMLNSFLFRTGSDDIAPGFHPGVQFPHGSDVASFMVRCQNETKTQ